MIALLELTSEFLVNGGGNDTQRECARKFKLLAIEEGRRVPRGCQGAAAIGVEPQSNAGGEAAVQATIQAAIEAGEDLRGAGCRLDEGADGADDERDGHSGL